MSRQTANIKGNLESKWLPKWLHKIQVENTLSKLKQGMFETIVLDFLAMVS